MPTRDLQNLASGMWNDSNIAPMSSGNQRKVVQSSAKNSRIWFSWSEKTTFSRTSCIPSKAAAAGTQLEMQFGDAKSDFRLHAFKSLGLHRMAIRQQRESEWLLA